MSLETLDGALMPWRPTVTVICRRDVSFMRLYSNTLRVSRTRNTETVVGSDQEVNSICALIQISCSFDLAKGLWGISGI
jgi:hypothetical protein